MAKAAAAVKNKELQRELRRAAQARRVAASSSSASSNMAHASSSTEVLVPEAAIPRQYVGSSSGVSVSVDSSVGLESLRNPAIREQFGITGITEAPRFGGLWTKKDLLSKKGLLDPVRLTMAEEELVTQWAFVRKAEMEKLNMINLGEANSLYLKEILRKSKNQLLDHMTPDDLAAIIKENKGFKILKEDGAVFNHWDEWDKAKKTFEKLFTGGKRKESKMFIGLTEEELQIWEYQVGNISRIWDQYDTFIDKAKVLNGLKPTLKE